MDRAKPDGPLVQPPPPSPYYGPISVIPWYVDAAAQRLKQGNLAGELIEQCYAADEKPILRFLETLNDSGEPAALTKLAGLLRTYPTILEHPYVWAVIRNLYSVASPIQELNQYAENWLRQLATAWAKGMTASLEKPGPKSRVKNPYPSWPGTEWVDVAWLDRDEEALRAYLLPKRRLLEWRGRGKKPENIKPRIEKLVMNALVKSGAARWSSALKEYVIAEQHGERIVERWKLLDLDAEIDRMLPPEHMGRAGRDGRAAYLAYAMLGKLLRKNPEKIMDLVKSYRRRRRKLTRLIV